MPNDLDIFLVIAEAFHVIDWEEESWAVFAHAHPQSRLGASVFWVTRNTPRFGIAAGAAIHRLGGAGGGCGLGAAGA
jgi:hypothetical protein